MRRWEVWTTDQRRRLGDTDGQDAAEAYGAWCEAVEDDGAQVLLLSDGAWWCRCPETGHMLQLPEAERDDEAAEAARDLAHLPVREAALAAMRGAVGR